MPPGDSGGARQGSSGRHCDGSNCHGNGRGRPGCQPAGRPRPRVRAGGPASEEEITNRYDVRCHELEDIRAGPVQSRFRPVRSIVAGFKPEFANTDSQAARRRARRTPGPGGIKFKSCIRVIPAKSALIPGPGPQAAEGLWQRKVQSLAGRSWQSGGKAAPGRIRH